jgi:hypothetical protein
MTSNNYAIAPIWFPGASYIGLTKDLSGLYPPLLDRIGVKPYSRATISTPRARLLRIRAILAAGGVECARIRKPLLMANRT